MDDKAGPSSPSKRAADDDNRDAAKTSKTDDDAQAKANQPATLDIEAIKQELTCNICLDIATRATTVLPCVHHFCWSCLKNWYSLSRNKCPRCSTVTTEGKVNAALNNICDLIVQHDPEMAKPADQLAEEAAEYEKYKQTRGNDATLRPMAAGYGYGAPPEDDEDPDYWPCPCCNPNNTTGFVCGPDYRIPDPPANAQGVVRPRPARGVNWPELDEIRDFFPDSAEEHTQCDGCTCWIPSNGHPEADCKSCHDHTCAPYDALGSCPGPAAQPYNNLENHPVTQAAFQADIFGDFHHEFNIVEQDRVREYWTEHNMTFRQVFDEFIESCLASCDGAPPDADGFTDVRKERQEDAEQEANSEDQSPEAIASRRLNRRRAAIESVYGEHGEEMTHHIGQLEPELAHAFLKGNVCGTCARYALGRIVEHWWEGVRRGRPETIKAEVRDLPDCWYGRECRTQSHNIPHCEKYNHVCPNTGKPPGYHDPAHAAAAAGEGQEDAADGDAAAAAAAAAAEEEDDSDDDDDIQEVDHPIGHQHPLLQPPVQLGAAPHPPGQVWIEIEDDDE